MTPHDIFNERERIEREGNKTLQALVLLFAAVVAYRKGFQDGYVYGCTSGRE